jgi:endonuclease/exonuclease/phosphatase family metal-dependent hydrolase
MMNRATLFRSSITLLAGCAVALGAMADGFAPADNVTLKVLSFNILEDAGTPSSSNTNAWIYSAGADRRDRVIRVIAEESPDIAGLQEAETNQVFDITHTNALAAYGWFGFGRDDGQSLGQHELVLYRADRFEPQASGVFWLSLSPDTASSQYPGAAKVRIAVWARLLDRWTGRQYLVMNTHWDYASAAARLYSAQLMRERMAMLASNSLVIVTGDFNMEPTDPAYAALLGTANSGSRQLRDAYRQAMPIEQANERTRHDFSGGTAGKRIDFVLQTDEFTTTTGAIVRTTYDGGRYPSDHYPVTATMTIVPERPVVLATTVDEDGAEVTWTCVSGLPYRVRSTADFLTWQDVYPGEGDWTATGAEGRCSLPFPPGATHTFYRVILRTPH